MKAVVLLWISILLICASISSCQLSVSQTAKGGSWVYTDLRVLDETDTPVPEQDMLAGYVRRLDSELQIRLDFLDLYEVPASDLYLAIDSYPGGSTELPWREPVDLAWDTLLMIPATGDMQVLAPDLSLRRSSGLRVVRDPVQDTVIISLKASSLPGGGLPSRLQVFATPSGSTVISDELGPFSSDGYAPEPASVLLAFWDSLPAYSPALGLRRWDGAHTGPFGGRHGLYNLLRTAHARQVPLALLDMKTPASLTALDYVGGLTMIQEMEKHGLLILPEVLPGFIPNRGENLSSWLQTAGLSQPHFYSQSRKIEASFGLSSSPFIFSPSGIPSNVAGSGQIIFTINPQLEEAQLTRWQQRLVLKLPPEPPPAAPTLNGPDLTMRQQLIQSALSSNRKAGSGLLVLGGDLPESAWANPEIARVTFAYLVSHPWIHILNAYDLLELPPSVSPTQLIQPDSTVIAPSWTQDINMAPDNSLTDLAWQAYASLFAPVYPHPPELPALREAYSGIVPVFLAAARWAEQPAPIQDCTQDIDLDGQPECLLGSEQLLAVIQPESGDLSFVFALGRDGPHQLIGPGYQFISGLSESKTWKIRAGFNSDPSAGSGAFRDPIQTGSLPLTYSLQPGIKGLRFNSSDGSVHKTYQLTDGSLKIELELVDPIRYEMPLALDPWVRFSPGWSQLFQATSIPDGWLWGLKQGPAVAVTSNVPLELNSILDSLDSIGQPENPNQEYPEGHWLPFPMANITIHSQSETQLKIRLQEEAR